MPYAFFAFTITMTSTNPATQLHLRHLAAALAEARKSPPKPTNFRVGCVIVSGDGAVLSTGYTLELPGNTHAEQCALAKLGYTDTVTPSPAALTSTVAATLYTTLEPCGKRLSGNLPCVERIIATRTPDADGGVRKVVFGAKEPGTFVQDSQSCRRLTEAGVEWEYVPGLESEILAVATEGHEKKSTSNRGGGETNIDDISPAERRRQEALPRNPKKRMMEVLPQGPS
ncbi:hypothetical protein DV738_g5014, partial [Chaetothyriales sp. CBS 135597]